MATAPLTLIKLRIFKSWADRTALEEEEPDIPPQMKELQDVLDLMGKKDRAYYMSTLKVMRAYTGFDFKEKRRERFFRSDYWCGVVDGAFIVSMGKRLFAGQLRYYMTVDLRAGTKEATSADINNFINYMRTMTNSKGKLMVHTTFNPDSIFPTLAEWKNIKEYFSPEEIAEINKNSWLREVDTPAE